ncbi:MAG TPA: hypothetical protein VK925_03385, partial [Jiangellaceae bacterium]|nr:hypothetical protein [Jiangellaceae bacterium]
MNEESSLARQAERLAELVGELAELPAIVADDVVRVDVIAGLERLKSAAVAAQLRVIERFVVSQEAASRGLGFAARAASRGVAEQVGLARRVSPGSASRQVLQARALVRELPR